MPFRANSRAFKCGDCMVEIYKKSLYLIYKLKFNFVTNRLNPTDSKLQIKTNFFHLHFSITITILYFVAYSILYKAKDLYNSHKASQNRYCPSSFTNHNRFIHSTIPYLLVPHNSTESLYSFAYGLSILINNNYNYYYCSNGSAYR